jgi:hypothetical protein
MNALIDTAEMEELPELDTEARPAAPAESLPPWTDAAEFCAAEIETPPEIVKGVLHQGCKLVVGGSSKSRKSWLLLDLALAVSSGTNWLNFPTTKARVLFVNLELPAFSIQRRLQSIAKARVIEIEPGMLTLWNLRGHAASYETLLPMIIAQAKAHGFGLVILDPSYKLLGDADENSASDIAKLLNALERLAVDTGAALAFSAHFAKGNASQKEAMDRISGSGVFARDPDAILVFTALQTEDAYAVESILRTLPPQPPFAIRWQHPAFQVADDLDPSDLKQTKRAVRATPTPEQVLALFSTNVEKPRAALLTAVELRQRFKECGWDKDSANAHRDRLEREGKLRVLIGAHGVKLAGLPAMVDAYANQQTEAGPVLEQTALPVQKMKRKKRQQ